MARKRTVKPTFDVPRTAVMRRDFYRLRREAEEEKRQQGIESAKSLHQRRAARLAQLDLNLAPNLPVSEHADEISQLIRDNPVVVVAGETGSGKTTQLPKLCLQLGLGVTGAIAHTQPRRLAARSVARRVADEVGAGLGDAIGFAVRFSDQVGDETLLKVMTDGLLLTEIRSDRYLNAYDVVIIDEAHERSLNIDFLLGYLKKLLKRRRDLKVIITSATIDVERFAQFFDNAPIVTVSGRTFPVEVRYQPQLDAEDPLEGVVQALHEIDAAPLGPARDVLTFFSGEREIFEAAKVLRNTFADRFEILPLYARLSFAEQRKIFAPSSKRRRVVLATNVAETSLTVPNIGFVIDPGYARISRYSYRSKLQRLPVEPVSQASADQRKGRCGRVAPGVCYRLYSEEDLLGRAEFTDAEIHRINLASVMLQMQAFKLGDIRRFDFLDPPDPRAIKDAARLLEELQALSEGRLTKIGQVMARMPIDPRLARMLVEAQRQGSLAEVLVIVAALAVQDPRERPMQKAQAADQSHATFADEKSDFLSFLNLWRFIEEQRQALTRNRFSTMLKKRFLSYQRVREWREIHRQLLLVCRQLGYSLNQKPSGYRGIHEAILSGSLSLIAQHDERGRYIGARNLKLRIFPGSALAGKTPKWIVAGEINETSQVYARQVAAVDPAWIERQAAHLLKIQFSDPFWSVKRGEVLAYNSVSLYGLRLAERRQVSFFPHDPAVCRDIFLRDALIRGQIKKPPDFLAHNLQEIARIEDLEAKGRRRDLLIDDDELYAFYAEHIPAHIARVSDLQKWLQRADATRVNALFLDQDKLLRNTQGLVSAESFPPELIVEGLSLSLSYRFAPGEEDDGVKVRIPTGVLSGISPELLEWSVPGFLPNVVEQWLRTLPKQQRRTLVPLPDKVDELTHALLQPDRYRVGRFLTALASLLNERYRLSVSEADWDRSRLDPQWLMYIEVVDENSRVIAAGRDLRVIKSKISQGAAQSAKNARLVDAYVQHNLAQFPEITLRSHEVIGDRAAPLIKYPGFLDTGESVDLHLFDDERERDSAHRAGLVRLALKQLGKVSGYFRKELDKHPQLGLHFAPFGNAAQLKDELLRAVVWYCFFEDRDLPRTNTEFTEQLAAGRGRLSEVFSKTVSDYAQILALRFECVRGLDALTSVAYEQSKADMFAQLNKLVPANVLDVTPSRYLRLLPRYLSGLLRRIENLPGHVPKDINKIKEIRPLCERLERVEKAELAEPGRCSELRFYLEELRLALFAEPVARQKVSNHPLDDAFFGPQWKASIKRVGQQLLAEERRLGLA